MKRYKAFIKYILISLIIFLCFECYPVSYATDNEYLTLLVIGEHHNNINPMFTSNGIGAQGPWYPGYSASGILRIQNKRGERTDISKLGMSINLSKNGKSLDYLNEDNNEDEKDYEGALHYMNMMKVKVDYQNPLSKFFKGNVFEGSFLDFVNGANCNISIGNNKDIDLVYTISMAEEADIRLAGISGKVDFTVTVEGDDVPLDGGSTGGSGGGGTTETEEEIIEEPIVVYPSLNGHWAHDCIIALLENEVIEGYEDGIIKPDNNITRAEAAVLVGKALDLKEKDKFFSGYIDAIPKWAKGYVIATTEEGIFKGYPMKLFKPGRNITREEMVAVLVRAFELKLEEDKELEFKDKDKISEWAEEYVKISVENKLIVGYEDNTFKADQNITRAEAFTIICKLLGYHEAHQDK